MLKPGGIKTVIKVISISGFVRFVFELKVGI